MIYKKGQLQCYCGTEKTWNLVGHFSKQGKHNVQELNKPPLTYGEFTSSTEYFVNVKFKGSGVIPPLPLADPRERQGHALSRSNFFFHFHAVFNKNWPK